MKRSITMLLTVLLVSCTLIRPTPIHDISFTFNRCRVQCYDLNKLELLEPSECNRRVSRVPNNLPVYFRVEPVGDRFDLIFEAGSYTLEACDEVIGFMANEIATEIRPKAIKNIQRCEDLRDN